MPHTPDSCDCPNSSEISDKSIQPDDWVYGPKGELLYVVDVREWASHDGSTVMSAAQCFSTINSDRAEWYTFDTLKRIEPDPNSFTRWAGDEKP